MILTANDISEYVEKMKDKKAIMIYYVKSYNNKYPKAPPSPTLLYKPDEIELINDAFDKLDKIM